MKHCPGIAVLFGLLVSAAACSKKPGTIPVVTPPVINDTSVHLPTSSLPFTDTFFGVWHDEGSGDLPNLDTTYNTTLYVRHYSPHGVILTGTFVSLVNTGHFSNFQLDRTIIMDTATVYTLVYVSDYIADRFTFRGDSLYYDKIYSVCLMDERGKFSGKKHR